MIGTAEATARVAFYLVPRFSMMAFTSALEVLRMANQLSGQPLYTWTLVSSDGQPVAASNGIPFDVSRDAESRDPYDAIIVCAGLDVHRVDDEAGLAWLRRHDRGETVLGAVCTGTWLLARAGLLDGYRCTIHYENLAAAREEFPALVISAELFEIDRTRYTCAGGTAPLDMMLSEVGRRHGAALANRVAEQYMCERIREHHDRQRVPLTQRIGASQPRLAEAVSLMEANIEEPMTLDELSRHVGLSRRQLERLFQRYLHVVPTRYYLELRLERARQLLLQTSMPIVDIALACGFISAPHFSKCYRDAFSLPPRDERRRAAGLIPGGTGPRAASAAAASGAVPDDAVAIDGSSGDVLADGAFTEDTFASAGAGGASGESANVPDADSGDGPEVDPFEDDRGPGGDASP